MCLWNRITAATLTLTEAQMRTPSGAEFSRGGKEAMQQRPNALKPWMLGACADAVRI